MSNNKEQAAAPPTATKPAAAPEQPAPAKELEAAAPSEPQTDYSDYSFTIEQKTEFNDALFASEDELNQALLQSHAENQATSADQSDEPCDAEANAANQPTELDFSVFKPAASDHIDGSGNKPATNKLLIINNSLNDSPARKTLADTAASTLFNQQLDAVIEQLKQQALHSNATKQANEAAPTNEASGQLSALTTLIKTTSLALSRKGKAKLEQSRAELDEYLGRSLPERSEPLDFMLPASSHKLLNGELLTEPQIKKLFTTKGKPLLSVLNKTEQQLSLLSKAQLSGSKKLALLRHYRPLLSDKLLTVIAMYERKPLAFDDSKRSATGSSSLAVIKLLITNYKQVYSEFYQSNHLYYGPHRATINQSACELFDYLLLELRLSIALHCPPPLAAIKTVNKLFQVLSLYEPQLLDEACYCSLDGRDSTLNAMFMRYQLWCFIDTQTLSSKLHKTLFAYLAEYHAQLALLPLAVASQLPTIAVGQQMLKIELHADQAATLLDPTTSHNEQQAPAVYMPTQTVFNRVKSDYVEALKSHIQQRQQHSSGTLNAVSPPQRLTLLAMLNQTIRNAEQQQAVSRYSLYQPVKLKAYCGLGDCHKLLCYRYAQHVSDGMDQTATAPKTILPPPASKGQWLIAGEDDKAIYLQIAEDRLGIACDIGQLLLLQRDDDTNNQSTAADSPAANGTGDAAAKEATAATETLLLTRIVRLERDHQGNVMFVASKLATTLTHVSILQDQQDIPAITALNNTERLLITDHQHRYSSHSKLAITFPDDSTTDVTISGLIALSPEYQLLKLAD